MEGPSEKVQEEIKWFECHMCNLKEPYHSKEKNVKFLKQITFAEDSYIMKDPFTPSEKKQFLVLGSDCCVCGNPVCQSNDCSIFYKQRYCQKCAWEKRNVLPQQLHTKIKKQD